MDLTPWATPLLLLPGVALLILSTATRFNRLHDEVHHTLHGAPGDGAVASVLLRRARLFRNALVELYLSVTLLGLSSVAALARAFLGVGPGAVLSTLAVLALLHASLQLAREATLALHVVQDHVTGR